MQGVHRVCEYRMTQKQQDSVGEVSQGEIDKNMLERTGGGET